MRIDRIRPHCPRPTELLIVRLVRRWAAAGILEEDALMAMTRLVTDAGEPPTIAVALHSVLQITEDCLGRPLQASCHPGLELSCDEQAMLRLIASAPDPGTKSGATDVPHGLPGVLCWAVASLRRCLGLDGYAPGTQPCRCPFRL